MAENPRELLENIDGHALYGLTYPEQRVEALQNIRDICRWYLEDTHEYVCADIDTCKCGETEDHLIHLTPAKRRRVLIEAVRQVMLDSHSSYFMRWEIRADSTKDMSQEVAAMFVDELVLPACLRQALRILPALGRLNEV